MYNSSFFSILGSNRGKAVASKKPCVQKMDLPGSRVGLIPFSRSLWNFWALWPPFFPLWCMGIPLNPHTLSPWSNWSTMRGLSCIALGLPRVLALMSRLRRQVMHYGPEQPDSETSNSNFPISLKVKERASKTMSAVELVSEVNRASKWLSK